MYTLHKISVQFNRYFYIETIDTPQKQCYYIDSSKPIKHYRKES